MLELDTGDGRQNGNYYSTLWLRVGIMEKKMGTTIEYIGVICRDN